MIRGVVFDLGSTLIRFNGVWPEVIERSRQALVQQLEALGLHLDGPSFGARFQRELEAYYHERDTEFIEITTAYLLRTVLAGDAHTAVPEAVIQQALRSFYAVSEAHWEPMPDVHRVLDELRRSGYRLGLISNAGDEKNVQRLIDRTHLRPYFDPILISAAVGLRKPNPALFHILLRQWNLPPQAAVMVGDTLGADILGAQNAGLRHIWLMAESDTPANLAHAGTIIPEATASTLAEVPAVIDRMSSSAA